MVAKKHVNAIVVGAGAGGGVVAKELAVAGLSVVLFERGGWPSYDKHNNDELISQRVTVLGNAFGPDNERYRRVIVDLNGNERIVLPSEGGYHNNAACVGSGTVSYGAMAWRFMPEDFKMRSVYGDVKGSTLEDWPVTYEDLEPYYEKAEWEIGVAGADHLNPFAPPRKKPHPMPPFEYNKEGQLLRKAAPKLGLHPFPIPMLRNSIPYGGRPACIHMRTCVGFACPVNAKCGTQNTVIPLAMETDNCELRTQSKVSRLLTNEQGRITGIEYYDADDKLQTQNADLVILAASATETARLLLNSKSRIYPRGIGNRHDWVGRNLQGHAYSGAYGIMEEEIFDDVGAGATIACCDYNHHNPGIIGGSMIANEFIRMPYLFTGKRPPGAPSWGKAHKEFQRNNYKKVMAAMGPVQQIPVFDARVQVDESIRDHWNIPVAKISGYKHPEDIKTGTFIAQKSEEWLKAAGAKQTWTHIAGKGVAGGQHQAGTCRMGNDPKTSVTDKYGRVHDTPNLFIADGSLHITNGGFNPALTIMALGYYVGDFIKNEWHKGNHFKGNH